MRDKAIRIGAGPVIRDPMTNVLRDSVKGTIGGGEIPIKVSFDVNKYVYEDQETAYFTNTSTGTYIDDYRTAWLWAQHITPADLKDPPPQTADHANGDFWFLSVNATDPFGNVSAANRLVYINWPCVGESKFFIPGEVKVNEIVAVYPSEGSVSNVMAGDKATTGLQYHYDLESIGYPKDDSPVPTVDATLRGDAVVRLVQFVSMRQFECGLAAQRVTIDGTGDCNRYDVNFVECIAPPLGYPNAIADFEISPASGLEPGQTFDIVNTSHGIGAGSTYPGTAWEWTGISGDTSLYTPATQTVTETEAGTRLITLTATDQFGTQSVSKRMLLIDGTGCNNVVEIENSYGGMATIAPFHAYVGETTTFEASAATIAWSDHYTFTADMAGEHAAVTPASITDAPGVFTFNEAGKYKLTLMAYIDAGCVQYLSADVYAFVRES